MPLSAVFVIAYGPGEIIGVRLEIEVVSQAVDSSADFPWRIQG
jgi:hypothetical protein